MAGLGIITIKEMESKGVSKRVSFVTEDALNKNILRIVGCSKYGHLPAFQAEMLYG